MGGGPSRLPPAHGNGVYPDEATKRLREKIAVLEAKNDELHRQLTRAAATCDRLEKINSANEGALKEKELKVLALTEELVSVGRERDELRQSCNGREVDTSKVNSPLKPRPRLQPLPPPQRPTSNENSPVRVPAQKAAGNVLSAAEDTTKTGAFDDVFFDGGCDGLRTESTEDEDEAGRDVTSLFSFDELRAALDDEIQLSDSELQELFEELAADRNGKITKEEFLAGVRARPLVEAMRGVTSLLHSSGVLEVLARLVHGKVKERMGWSTHAEMDVSTLLSQAKVDDVRSAWQEAENEVVGSLATALGDLRARQRDAVTAREFNDKYAADNSTLKEAVYNELTDFRAGVEGALGLPGKDVFGGIAMEFCHSEDSRDEFVTSNYGGTRTTPAREFEFVLHGDASRDYGGGRTVVPLQVYLYATSAKKANSDSEFYDAALDDMDGETRDSVQGVLMLRVKEAGLTTCFLTAAAEHDATLQRLAAMSRRELVRVQKQVGRVLNSLSGREAVSFQAMARAMEAGGQAVTREEMGALVARMREALRAARLWEEEIVGLRLYTGPAYMKLNAVLREKREGLKGNNYVCTIYAAISGMAKLAEMSPIPENRIVYRGQRGMRLPECFWRENSQGVKGGVEMAFLSTTTDVQVAINYAAGDIPTVLALEVGAVDRGAAVGFVSQYPAEDEILMPPRGFMEVVGEPGIMTTEGGPVLSVPVKLNCNLLCPTLEKLQQSRKTMLVSTLEHVRKEVVRDVDAMAESKELRERARVDYFWRFKDERGGRRFIESIKQEAGRALAEARQRPAAWYNKDVCFRRAMQQALAVHKKALGKLQLWLEERTLHVARINALSAEDCDRKAAARLRRLMDEAEAAAEGGAEGEAAREQRRVLAARLCRQMELIGEDVNEVVDAGTGETALMLKSAEGVEEAVRLLLEARADVEAARGDGMTALMLAARGGHTGIVTRLVREGGADANRQDNLVLRHKRQGGAAGGGDVRGFSALMYAAENGHSRTVRALIGECGADGRGADESGRSAAHLAAHNGHLDTLELLEREGRADVHAEKEGGTTAVMMAAQNGHLAVVEWLVKQRGAKVNASKCNGWTPLMSAASNGEEAMVSWLIREGAADVHVRRDKGWTALLYAATNGHVGVVRALVGEGGADASGANSAGWTPLISAAGAGHEGVVAWLVAEGGVSPDQARQDGGTALMTAAASGHEGVVRWLVTTGGAKVDAGKKDGWTALMGAAANGHVGVVSLLLDAKAHVEARKADGWTALMAAALHGHKRVVVMLVEQGAADVNASSANGTTALMAAAQKGHAGTAQWLVGEGKAKVHARRDDGHDALMYAAANNHVGTVATLVRDGKADVNATNAEGGTALMSAVAAGHKRVVAWLVKAGAKLDATDAHGNTALGLAKTRKQNSIATLLREAGAAQDVVRVDGSVRHS